MASEECERLQLRQYIFWRNDLSDVCTVQRGKSPERLSRTADIMRRHGFEKESRLLAGRQSRPSSISLCYVVQWSLLGDLVTSIDWRCP